MWGDLVRRRRLQAGLTQKDLARLAGIGVRSLRDIEQDRARPRPLTVRRLADALGLTRDERESLATAATHNQDREGVSVSVLGPLSVRRHGAPVDLSAPMRRDLLGLLAVQNHQVVTLAEMVGVLWDDDPPSTYPSQITAMVAALRQCLEPERPSRQPSRVLIRTGAGYRCELDDDHLDLARFERLGRDARRAEAEGAPADAVACYEQALGLWRGPVLAGACSGLSQHPSVVAVGRRLVTMTTAFADLALAHGHAHQALPYLQVAASRDPLHEGLYARLIRALADNGEHATALRSFTEIRGRLDRELGLAPGAEVTAAHADVLRRASEHRPGQSTPDPYGGAPTQLPRDVPAFTGRHRELESLDALLTDADRDQGQPAAVCVIGGAPGIGKTTLAVHWAHRNRARFPDGQLYLNLRGFGPANEIVDPTDAVSALLEALGVPAARQPALPSARIGQYRTTLTGRRVLILLDNALDAQQVRPLLPASSGCLVLVTSRTSLAGLVVTEGAHALTLEKLTGDDAMDLLARRIGAPRIAGGRTAAEEIVERCAGLPLALAIVAARAILRPRVPLSSLARELSGHHRLAALDAGAGTDVQSDLRALFSWSYDALPAEAARCFRMIGSAPGVTIAPASAAALIDRHRAQTQALLDQLCHAHLLGEQDDDRYAMHDLLRDYAGQLAEALDPQDERHLALRRLGDHLVITADAAVTHAYPNRLRVPLPLPAIPAPRFADTREALEWTHAELANLVALVTRAAEHGLHRTVALLADILRAYFWAGHGAGQALVIAGVALRSAQADEDPHAEAAACLSVGQAYYRQARYGEANERLRRAAELTEAVNWPEGRAEALSNIGDVLAISGSPDAADRHYRSALDIQEDLGWLDRVAGELNSMTVVATMVGDLGLAQEYATKAVVLARQGQSPYEEATALGNLAELHRYTVRFDDALDGLSAAVALNERLERPVWVAANRDSLALLHRDRGELNEALLHAEAALALIQQLDRPHIEACILNTLGTVSLRLGRGREAVAYHQRAVVLAQQGDDHAETGSALLGLAQAETAQGDSPRALTRLRSVLDLSREHGYRLLEADVLVTMVEIHARSGRLDDAGPYVEAATELHRDMGYTLGEIRLQDILRDRQRRS